MISGEFRLFHESEFSKSKDYGHGPGHLTHRICKEHLIETEHFIFLHTSFIMSECDDIKIDYKNHILTVRVTARFKTKVSEHTCESSPDESQVRNFFFIRNIERSKISYEITENMIKILLPKITNQVDD